MKKDYCSFVQETAEELEKSLGAGYSVRRQEVRKNNGVTYQAVMISDHASNVSPYYSMESYYKLYEKPGDIKAIAEDILKLYREEKEQDFPLDWICDRAGVLGRVLMRIVSTDRNAGLLGGVPHHDLPELNLSILFYFFLENGNGRHATMLAYNRHMAMWRTSKAELLKHAWENTALSMGHTIRRVDELLNGYMEPAAPPEFPPMYIATNRQLLYGAVCILYPDVQEDIAQRLGSDFYILPSSVHEIIAVPAESLDISHAESLKAIVGGINRSELAYEEVLSDNVYYYSREKHTLSLAV